MFVLVWSQVQHGSGSINHVMIVYPFYRFAAYQRDTGWSYHRLPSVTGIRFTRSIGDRSSSTLPHAKQHLLNLFCGARKHQSGVHILDRITGIWQIPSFWSGGLQDSYPRRWRRSPWTFVLLLLLCSDSGCLCVWTVFRSLGYWQWISSLDYPHISERV